MSRVSRNGNQTQAWPAEPSGKAWQQQVFSGVLVPLIRAANRCATTRIIAILTSGFFNTLLYHLPLQLLRREWQQWVDLAISRAAFERLLCGMEQPFTAANRSSIAGQERKSEMNP
jgi:hypothetical protein